MRPRRAVYGPAAATQHVPSRRQVRSVAYVVRATFASTVSSCLAVAGVSRPFARFCGQAAAIAAATSKVRASTAPEYAGSMRIAVLVLAAVLVGGASAATEPPRRSTRRSSRCAGTSCAIPTAPAARSAPPQLRTLHVSHWGFDGRPTTGSIVVARRVAQDVVDSLPHALVGALPDPAPAAGVRLPRQRRRLDGGRQHLRLQLPLRRRHLALVDARLRRGDRRQPGREPVRPRLDRLTARRPRVPRSQPLPQGHGRSRTACSCARSRRSAGSGAPRSATTSTSRRRAAEPATCLSSTKRTDIRALDEDSPISRAASRTAPRRRTARSRRGGSRSRGSPWRRAARPRR